MNKINLFLFLIIVAFIYGCGGVSGFNQGLINEKLSYKVETTEKEIARVMKLKPQLTAPFRLAIYLDQKIMNYWSNTYWRWSEKDKEKIFEQLKDYNGDLFSDVFFIPASMVNENNVKAIRLAAARHNADAVLVIRGINDVDAYGNIWAMSYITILCGWLVPGTEVDSYFKISAALWDVRNEYLYSTVESDSYKHETVPAFKIRKEEIVEENKKEVFSLFMEEFKKRLNLLNQVK